ncbi:MAG TPA: hypothetical protein VMA31_03295 [Bryobacteraceae bacterium]|nr:hypothetical protein [Bryobacteraceae bacterium]
MQSKAWIPMVALALAAVPLASAKSYGITLDSAVKAGGQQLAAGQYSLKVQGSNAVLVSSDTGRRFTLPVTVKKVDKKFSNTAVETIKAGDSDRVNAIDLGGSNVELDFGD